MREDIHKPSLLDPAEYGYMAAFYQGDSHWMAQAYQDEMEAYEEAILYNERFDGNFTHKGTCDHCGAAFNHGVLFMHEPTQELVHIGHICAANTVGLPDKAAAIKKKAEKFAAEMREKEKLQEAGREWREANPEIIAFLEALPEDANYFIKDMARAVKKWGRLTDGQHRATVKFIEREAQYQAQKIERDARVKDAPPLEAGRIALQGEIISTKWQDSPYGEIFKMLVQLENGNRVFGTVPASLHGTNDELKGRKIAFTATLKASDKDGHFGWFSRPANARFC